MQRFCTTHSARSLGHALRSERTAALKRHAAAADTACRETRLQGGLGVFGVAWCAGRARESRSALHPCSARAVVWVAYVWDLPQAPRQSGWLRTGSSVGFSRRCTLFSDRYLSTGLSHCPEHLPSASASPVRLPSSALDVANLGALPSAGRRTSNTSRPRWLRRLFGCHRGGREPSRPFRVAGLGSASLIRQRHNRTCY